MKWCGFYEKPIKKVLTCKCKNKQGDRSCLGCIMMEERDEQGKLKSCKKKCEKDE